ncbi:MinD/ParA family protein [Bacillaceae bacterium Marseille-Q3522]|nr:MinD/ParA family protein [Bacillaceae bacterium Marseille-Q3522]
MRDQAERLRERFEKTREARQPKTIAVVSGKGGVGKSNIALNFALSLQKKASSVLLFDLDIGMGNIDILMGGNATYSIVDFFEKNLPLQKIIHTIPNMPDYIAGGTGLTHFFSLDGEKLNEFFTQLTAVFNKYDYVFFDMGAGMTEDSLQFILAADEIFIVTTPEPTAVADAYAAMKSIFLRNHSIPFQLIINRVQSKQEGEETFTRLAKVLQRFLGKDISFLGTVPDDRTIQMAVRKQIPFLEWNEKAGASKALVQMTDKYDKKVIDPTASFLTKLKRFFFERL